MATMLTALETFPIIAAVPLNDDFESATSVIEPLPFTDAINTAEATTAADDPDCAGNGSTVWYVFAPTQNMRITAHTFGSDYDTTLSVYTGTRGNLNQIACNDDYIGLQSLVTFDAVAGQLFFLMVGAFDGETGGNLVFTVKPPPLPPSNLSINSVESVNRLTGDAIVTGTVTCSAPTFVSLSGELRQKAGHFDVVHGSFGFTLQCNDMTPWSVTVRGDNGPFNSGQVKVSTSSFTFDPNTGESSSPLSVTRVVHLKAMR
jgi:hypothetical protein